MKKVIFGSVAILAMTIYFLLQNTDSNVLQDHISTKQSASKSLKIDEKQLPSLKEIANQKINPKLEKVAQKDISSHACHKIIDQFMENPYEEILENPESIYQNLKETECQNALIPTLKKNPMLFKLSEKCLKNPNKECDSFIFYLKTWSVATKYPDSIDLADLDETILANKLMYNFSSNPALPVDVLDKNLEILDEMISKNPNLYGAQKAKLIHLFAKEFQYGADVEEEFNNTLDALNSLKSDPAIDEIVLLRPFQKRISNKEEVSENIENFIAKYPSSPKGPYYKAALEWNASKNREKTLFWLNRARSVDPNDPQVLDTLEKFKKAKTGDSIFYFSFQFDPQEV